MPVWLAEKFKITIDLRRAARLSDIRAILLVNDDFLLMR